jgi:hypothetical protein
VQERRSTENSSISIVLTRLEPPGPPEVERVTIIMIRKTERPRQREERKKEKVKLTDKTKRSTNRDTRQRQRDRETERQRDRETERQRECLLCSQMTVGRLGSVALSGGRDREKDMERKRREKDR